jgi:RNA 3'-terminal phosphate cyclase (ATP)
MLHIDGAQQSGSGTIIRLAISLSALLGEPVRITHARARRAKPGLRPQHLAAVKACAELCGARLEGVEVGAQDFTFAPRTPPRGGDFVWDIGTAGSATMLALGVLPVACRAGGPLRARITGGVFQDFAPSPHHMQHVLAPLLARMGVAVETTQGSVREVVGVAFSSHLEERRVSERMAHACEERLLAHGFPCRIERVHDVQAVQAGASLAVWADTNTGARLGADRAGAPRRSSEAIGHFVAEQLLADLQAGGSVDRHAADQLAPFAALAEGTTRYVAPRVTDHLTTNLWLAERFGAKVSRHGRDVRVQGLAR